MPEQEMNFGNINVHGGIQNFGGTSTNTQHNYAAPADQIRDLLAAIRDQHPDPDFARQQVMAIQGEIQEGTPEARGRVEARLRRLADSATSTRTVVEAIAAVGAIVAAGWPF